MSHLISVACPCGKTFEVPQWKVNAGRGKRCSKECQYRYATRPSGLTYNVTKENPTAFKRGDTPWNAGTIGVMQAWNKGVPGRSGEEHPQWKGDEIGYFALHMWLARVKPKTGHCEDCGAGRYTEYANISYEYRRDPDDYRELCKPCHVRQDRASGHWGAATQRIKADAS